MPYKDNPHRARDVFEILWVDSRSSPYEERLFILSAGNVEQN